MTKSVMVATSNPGKLAEMRRIMALYVPESFWDLKPLPADFVVSWEETGSTFAENALIKARGAFSSFGMASLADDSGLCVDALGGAPGVLSARYSGEHGRDQAHVAKLLSTLLENGAHEQSQRRAHFFCALALILADGTEFIAEGKVAGYIAPAPRGNVGFGYDPVFSLEPDGPTFAELGESTKNSFSHRRRAFERLAKALRSHTKFS